MKRSNVLQSLAVLILFSQIAWGAVPQLINFQGILKDGTGNPVADGSYSVTFTIYDDPNGGNIFWQETQSVSTTNGLFTVLLGSSSQVPDSVFYDTLRYLGIQVGADREMTPRQRLSSVGYSSVSSQWTSAGEDLFKLNGNVGLGTSSPSQKLHVETGFGTGAAVFVLGGGGPLIGDAAVSIGTAYNGRHGLSILTSNNNLSDSSHAALWIENEGFGGLTFYAGDQSPDPTPFVIDNGGNVGIGTTSPVYKLDVVGDVRASGNLFVPSQVGFLDYINTTADGFNGFLSGSQYLDRYGSNYNVGGAWDRVSGTFTVPVTGRYIVNIHIMGQPSALNLDFRIYRGAQNFARTYYNAGAIFEETIFRFGTIDGVWLFNAGELIRLRQEGGCGAHFDDSWISINLLY